MAKMPRPPDSPVPAGPPSAPPSAPVSTTLKGIAGSPGVALGHALVLGDVRASYTRRHIRSWQVDAELARVQRAVEDARASLKQVSSEMAATAPTDPNFILEAYLFMLGDDVLHERIGKKIRDERKCAEWAVATAGEDIAKLFGDAGARDAYIA